MKNNEHSQKHIDEIMNVFHQKKALEAPAGFTQSTIHRVLFRIKSREFYLPVMVKIAASVILLVVNTYTIYFFTRHENHAPVSVNQGALVRFYQPADTSTDFAYQLIGNR